MSSNPSHPRVAARDMDRFSARRPAGAVEIAEDFRDRLIIDRYDPAFASMRAGRRRRLHAAGAHDAVTWNVFRSLRQIASSVWLPELFMAAFPELGAPPSSHAVVSVWRTFAPPPSLLDEAEEGEAEVDVVIEAPGWVWFIEAAHGRESQLLRTLHLGSHHAGVRTFYFSLLAADATEALAAGAAVREHPSEGLANLGGVSTLRFADLADVLADVSRAHATRGDERHHAERALEWMRRHGTG